MCEECERRRAQAERRSEHPILVSANDRLAEIAMATAGVRSVEENGGPVAGIDSDVAVRAIASTMALPFDEVERLMDVQMEILRRMARVGMDPEEAISGAISQIFLFGWLVRDEQERQQ